MPHAQFASAFSTASLSVPSWKAAAGAQRRQRELAVRPEPLHVRTGVAAASHQR